MRRLPYYLEKFDPERAAPFEVQDDPCSVMTADGIQINGFLLDGCGREVYVVVHGLMGHCRAPGYRQFSESLTRYGRVLAADLRGHGISAGSSTLGNKEAFDVAALIKMARSLSDVEKVTVIGFSMGAAASIRAAALFEPCDSIISISSPAHWHGHRRWAARRTALIWRVPGGTLALHMLTGVRIEPVWADSESPASVLTKVSPASVLIVHGGSDQFFPPQEGRDLFASASEPKGLWEIPEGGHAEGLFVDPGRSVDRIRVDGFVDECIQRAQRVAQWR